MFFICTLHASKVIFVTFNLNCGLHIFSVGKTVCVDVKFLDGSNFLYPKPNCIFVSRTPLMQFSLIQNNCTVPTKRKLPPTNTAANTNIIIITDIIFTVINDIKVWDNSANLHDKHKNCTIKPNKMTTHYWVPQHTQHSCRVVNS